MYIVANRIGQCKLLENPAGQRYGKLVGCNPGLTLPVGGIVSGNTGLLSGNAGLLSALIWALGGVGD